FRFFEPLWGVKRDRYRPGTAQRIRFAAFGHAMAAMNGAEAPKPAAAAPGETAGPLMPPAPAIALPSALVMIGPGLTSRYGISAPILEWRGFWTGDRL